MQDLPEDISNKKYISIEPETKRVQDELNQVKFNSIQSPDKANETYTPVKKSVKQPRKPIEIGKKLNKLFKFIRAKWKIFREVQYPLIYAKIYDLYYFELVPYRPIDIALKVLIIITLIIILLIILIILGELLRLLFY